MFFLQYSTESEQLSSIGAYRGLNNYHTPKPYSNAKATIVEFLKWRQVLAVGSGVEFEFPRDFLPWFFKPLWYIVRIMLSCINYGNTVRYHLICLECYN